MSDDDYPIPDTYNDDEIEKLRAEIARLQLRCAALKEECRGRADREDRLRVALEAIAAITIHLGLAKPCGVHGSVGVAESGLVASQSRQLTDNGKTPQSTA